jgi:WD40 repeat protein
MAGENGNTASARSSARIFLSYSRKDMAFADRLDEALKARGFEPLIDRSEIYAFEDWWKRIQALIARADTVVFVLSPDSITSEVAQREVAYAAMLNKRFAPVVFRRTDASAIPEVLRRLNFVFFDEPAQFEASADLLAEALHTDIGWIRQHTEFGEAARHWASAGRPSGLLLRSPALEDAERWIVSRPEGAPTPSDPTPVFIAESRHAAVKRRNVLLAGLTTGLVLAIGLAGIAYWQRENAKAEAAVAIRQRNTALIVQSNFLNDTSNSRRELGDATLATALALEALPGSAAESDRPYVAGTELTLKRAFRDVLELQFKPSTVQAGGGLISTAVLSPDGERIATASGSVVRLWDAKSGLASAVLPAQDSDVWALFFGTPDQLIAASKTSLRLWSLSGPTLISELQAPIGEKVCGWRFNPTGNSPPISLGTTSAADPPLGKMMIVMHTPPQHMVIGSEQCSLMAGYEFPQAMNRPLSIEMRMVGGTQQSVSIDQTFNLGLIEVGAHAGFHVIPSGAEKYLSASLSPDGRQAVTVTESGTAVIWDVRNGIRLVELPAAKSVVRVSFSDDSQLILAAQSDGAMQLWARQSISEWKTLGQANNTASVGASKHCGGFDATFSGGANGVGIALHAASAAAQQKVSGAGNRMIDFACSRDGHIAVIAETGDAPGFLRVITFSDQSATPLSDHQSTVDYQDGEIAVRVSPDGHRLALFGGNLFRLWDIDSGKAVRDIALPTAAQAKFLAAVFNVDGTQLATYRSDGTLALLDCASGETLDESTWNSIAGQRPISLDFDGDGRHLVVDLGIQRYAWTIYPSLASLIDAAEDAISFCVAPEDRRSFSLSDEPPTWCISRNKKPYDTAAWHQWLADKQAGRNPQLPYQPQTRS